MANITSKQIVLDGWRNAVVKFAGALDTSDVTDTVTLANFTNNEPSKTLYAFRVNRVRYSVDGRLAIELLWNASTPQLIVGLANSSKLDFDHSGGLLPANSAAAGFDGTINFLTKGYTNDVAPGTVVTYTVEVELIKLYK